MVCEAEYLSTLPNLCSDHRLFISKKSGREAIRYGSGRFWANKEAKSPGSLYRNPKAKKTEEQALRNDIQAMAAEILFSRLFRLPFDKSLYPRAGGYDSITNNYVTIDVKQTAHEDGMLLAEEGKMKSGWDTDLYLLFTGTIAKGWVYRGWLWTDELFEGGLNYDMPRPCYSKEQDVLHDWFPLNETFEQAMEHVIPQHEKRRMEEYGKKEYRKKAGLYVPN